MRRGREWRGLLVKVIEEDWYKSVLACKREAGRACTIRHIWVMYMELAASSTPRMT